MEKGLVVTRDVTAPVTDTGKTRYNG